MLQTLKGVRAGLARAMYVYVFTVYRTFPISSRVKNIFCPPGWFRYRLIYIYIYIY